MSGAKPLIPTYAFMVKKETNLHSFTVLGQLASFREDENEHSGSKNMVASLK
jgi:hypothetical protein